MSVSAWLERRIGPRLRGIAEQVVGARVADIGSDHGLLPAYLLRSGRVAEVVVVEKTRGPYERSRAALARVAAEVRLGDGFSVIEPGEVACATLSGFGAQAMAEILARHPDRLPARLVVQPNHSAQHLRAWAQANGYRIRLDSEVAEAGRTYPLLVLEAP